jgi:hypothetical protein
MPTDPDANSFFSPTTREWLRTLTNASGQPDRVFEFNPRMVTSEDVVEGTMPDIGPRYDSEGNGWRRRTRAVPSEVSTITREWLDRARNATDIDSVIEMALINSAHETELDDPFYYADGDKHLLTCALPWCFKVKWMTTAALRGGAMLQRCNSCGTYSMVPVAGLITNPEEMRIQPWMYTQDIDGIERMGFAIKAMLSLRRMAPDVVDIYKRESMVWVSVKMGGSDDVQPHFIRARANEEALSEEVSVVNVAIMDQSDGQPRGWPLSDIIGLPRESMERFFDVLYRYTTRPGEIIDERLADSMRIGYTQEQWENAGGRTAFIEYLIDRDIVVANLGRCNSLAGSEFFNTLYGVLITRLDITPVIKKKGGVNWKFEKLIDHLDYFELGRIWQRMANDPSAFSEVFRVEAG